MSPMMETATAPPKPYYEDAAVTIYHGDCLEILPSLPSVDVVVADPPYTFGLASSIHEGKAGSWGDLMNNAVWYALWLADCKRLTAARQGAAWVFNSWRTLPVLAKAASSLRWPIESMLVWDKQWIGPGGSRGLRPSYELVALFVQQGFALKDRGLPDIWPVQWSSHKPNSHPAEKPLALISKIITESDGDLVLDPFMGSGTTLRAAKDLGRRAIGIEIEERFCQRATERMSQAALPVGAKP